MNSLLKAVPIAVLFIAVSGCSIGRLHVDVIDMNNSKSIIVEDAPAKPAAHVTFQWNF